MIGLEERLLNLFLHLDEWRREKAFLEEISSCDRLAILSLKISCALLDDHRLGSIIGKYLSLIIDEQSSHGTTHEKLLQSFCVVEKDLEVNLRGFSALMDFILEEGKIRYDGIALLNQIPNLDVSLRKQFSSLVKTLTTYCELDEAFCFDIPKATALIFLLSLTQVHALLSSNEKNTSTAVIARWLSCRSKNMVLLYEKAIGIESLSTIRIFKNTVEKELLVLRLCFMVANGETVNVKDAVFFDRLLKSLGMIGLKPFVDAGFLTTKIGSDDRDGTKLLKGQRYF